MTLHHPVTGEKARVQSRLRGAYGFALALQQMSDKQSEVSSLSVQSIADALTFHLEQLMTEFGIESEEGA